MRYGNGELRVVMPCSAGYLSYSKHLGRIPVWRESFNLRILRRIYAIADGINLTNQHQQRQMQLYIQSTEASLKQLPGSDPLIAAEIQLQELAECANQLNQSLVLVGHVSPMFDINYLTKEGVTNISGLDQQYMSVCWSTTY